METEFYWWHVPIMIAAWVIGLLLVAYIFRGKNKF